MVQLWSDGRRGAGCPSLAAARRLDPLPRCNSARTKGTFQTSSCPGSHQETRSCQLAIMLAGSLVTLTVLVADSVPEVTPTVTPSSGPAPDTIRTSVTTAGAVSTAAPPEPITPRWPTGVEAMVVFAWSTVENWRGCRATTLEIQHLSVVRLIPSAKGV